MMLRLQAVRVRFVSARYTHKAGAPLLGDHQPAGAQDGDARRRNAVESPLSINGQMISRLQTPDGVAKNQDAIEDGRRLVLS